MYSALTLLPELDAGFVMMTNGLGDEARTVLVQALSDLLVRPGGARPLAWYADVLQRERDNAPPARRAPDTSARTVVAADDPSIPAGLYRDPWFGEVRLCADDRGLVFASAKSPQLTGRLMRLEERLMVDWFDDSIGTDAWVEFRRDGDRAGMTMAKVDPEADFSYDFEDLAFERVASCQ